jgi:hypothetical protein
MMTAANMLAGALREANRKIARKRTKKECRYEYIANVNRAAGVLKDRLIGILIADNRFVRKYLYRELVSEIKRRIVPIRQTERRQGKNT